MAASLTIAAVAMVAWVLALCVPWRAWRICEVLEPASPEARLDAARIAVLIPARNEERHIGRCLESILVQGQDLQVVVVDDRSTDRTAALARSYAGVEVVDGRPAPAGWSGKLWALEQGYRRIDSGRDLVLLVDADIRLAPGMLAALEARLVSGERDLVSIMAHLSPSTRWESLLLPAFVYFFRQLYPFALVNSDHSRLAAAAGGCVLVRRRALERAGAFGAWRDALIDDCELARRIKREGGRIWLGLSRSVESVRRHERLASIWSTVRRTAYTQLRYSPVLLLATSVIMAVLFAGPWLGVLSGHPAGRVTGLVALGAMFLGYWPMIRFYRLHPGWTLGLAVAGPLFLVMTWDSARCHWLGRGSAWKGRYYATPVSSNGRRRT